MKPILRPFYIFALNTNDEMESHILLNEGVRNTQFKALQGVYKEQKETSYLVDVSLKDTVMKLAREYNQETVLFVDETRNAFLVYLKDDSVEPLGAWEEVQNVSGLDNYTIDVGTGKVYRAS